MIQTNINYRKSSTIYWVIRLTESDLWSERWPALWTCYFDSRFPDDDLFAYQLYLLGPELIARFFFPSMSPQGQSSDILLLNLKTWKGIKFVLKYFNLKSLIRLTLLVTVNLWSNLMQTAESPPLINSIKWNWFMAWSNARQSCLSAGIKWYYI